MAAPRISDPTAVNVFVVFQIVTWVGHAGMLITALVGSNVRRHITWYNFTASWIISGLSYSLLTLAGQQFSPRLNSALCFIQATLIYASPALTGSTTLALVIHLWFSLKSMLRGDGHDTARRRNIILIIYPYIAFFLVFLVVLVDGALHGVHRADERAYCVVQSHVPGRMASVCVAGSMIAVVVLESFLARFLYRNWISIKGHGAQGRQYLSLAVRVSVFTAVGLMAMIVSFIIFFLPTTQWVDVILATIPLASILVFWTKMDHLRACMFWKKKPQIEMHGDLEKKQTGA